MDAQSQLKDAITRGDAEAAVLATERLLGVGRAPLGIIEEEIVPGMQRAGELFEEGEFFVPELLMAARATKAVFDLLRPILVNQGIAPVARVILGTVEGDLHDIGKNLVAAMLEGGGFEVVDLGVGVKPERFVAALADGDLVGISALLTTTLPAMRRTVEALLGDPRRPRIRIMVGGAPVTEAFAAKIGADGYAPSAATSVELAVRLSADLKARRLEP